MYRSLLVKEQAAATAALSIATLGTVPPVAANMVDIRPLREGWTAAAPANGSGFGPQKVRLRLKGGQAGAQTLTGATAFIWGLDADGVATKIGRVNGGTDITIALGFFHAEVLVDVAGSYTHIGVTGTLSASTMIIEITPIETQE